MKAFAYNWQKFWASVADSSITWTSAAFKVSFWMPQCIWKRQLRGRATCTAISTLTLRSVIGRLRTTTSKLPQSFIFSNKDLFFLCYHKVTSLLWLILSWSVSLGQKWACSLLNGMLLQLFIYLFEKIVIQSTSIKSPFVVPLPDVCSARRHACHCKLLLTKESEPLQQLVFFYPFLGAFNILALMAWEVNFFLSQLWDKISFA